MKKQTGFISSSSSVTITYTTSYGSATETWSSATLKNGVQVDQHDGETWQTEKMLTSETLVTTDFTWTTFTNTNYQRIESFLEAVEKLNSPYSSNTNQYLNLTNYSKIVAARDLYKGFVDIVITFPTEIRLAGIELLNPWVNKLMNSTESSNWMYLPSKFKIYKVNTSKTNDYLEKVTYETDVAKKMNSNGELTDFRPIRYDQLDNDENLTFLGSYNVNWKNTASYKCFFKYNDLDDASVNLKLSDTNTGTATWKCKQLVLRILDTKMSSSSTVKQKKGAADGMTNIKYKICKYIYENELTYGTKYKNEDPEIEDCADLIGMENISSDTKKDGWTFGSSAKRSYMYSKDVKFESGINYKLGGIQLLLSPDIFSVAEMKMYNYANRTNNKVFIGEWNKDYQEIEYYGTGLIKTSPDISISDENLGSVKWKHNFNIPPRYLDVQLFAKFTLDFDTFYKGDIISNLTNIDKEPLTIKLTGDEVQVNLSNGVGFTNPETGEFMTFLNGVGVQMDKEGDFDAYNAALAVGAENYILDYGSNIASKMTGGYPFDIYFVVKRLF